MGGDSHHIYHARAAPAVVAAKSALWTTVTFTIKDFGRAPCTTRKAAQAADLITQARSAWTTTQARSAWTPQLIAAARARHAAASKHHQACRVGPASQPPGRLRQHSKTIHADAFAVKVESESPACRRMI